MKIDATTESPEFVLDREKNYISLKGKSILLRADIFYRPISQALVDYLENDKPEKVKIDINIEYINTTSIKRLYTLFEIFNDFYKKGIEVELTWHYYFEDDISEEIGLTLNEMLDFEMIFAKYDDE